MSDQDREQWGGGRSEGGRRDGGRRSGDQRDGGGGGFRIRLSDNELAAARTLQEAFQLRSTVAVLGFSLRTMAQLLEQGALDEVVSQQRRSGGNRPPRGERRGDGDGRNERGSRPNPFARPSKPVAEPEPEAEVEATATPETSDEAAAEASTDATTAEATSEN
ncbi:MAG: hypothetical protein VKJ31_03330 [Synechococcus sp.]|nr:hypothetical protein [Synechococcus sp.]